MLWPPFLSETRKRRAGRRACRLTILGLRRGAEPGYQRYVFLTSRLDCAFCSPADKAGLFCRQGLMSIATDCPTHVDFAFAPVTRSNAMSIQPRLLSQFYWPPMARRPHGLIPAMSERTGSRRGLGMADSLEARYDLRCGIEAYDLTIPINNRKNDGTRWPFACRGLRGITRKTAVCVPGYPCFDPETGHRAWARSDAGNGRYP